MSNVPKINFNKLIIAFILSTVSSVSLSVTRADVEDTIDCIAALSVHKIMFEETNNYKEVKFSKELIRATENKMYAQLDLYIKEKLQNNEKAFLDISEMTKNSFDTYKSWNLLQQSKYAKQVIDTNRCLYVEKIHFKD